MAGETKNIAENHPRVVSKLQDLADLYILELGDQGHPGPGVRQAGYVREAYPMNLKSVFQLITMLINKL